MVAFLGISSAIKDLPQVSHLFATLLGLTWVSLAKGRIEILSGSPPKRKVGCMWEGGCNSRKGGMSVGQPQNVNVCSTHFWILSHMDYGRVCSGECQFIHMFVIHTIIN